MCDKDRFLSSFCCVFVRILVEVDLAGALCSVVLPKTKPVAAAPTVLVATNYNRTVVSTCLGREEGIV